MTTSAGDDISEDQFMQAVSTVCASDASLSPLGAALLIAHRLGVARDSRTFARNLGVEHALVLREISGLDDGGFLLVTSRNARTQRAELALTERGERLAALAGPKSLSV
jgi:hypothetical protein